MLYRVHDLSPQQKHAAEVLLGRAVSLDEMVSIKSLDATTIIPCELSPDERIAALRAVEQRYASRDVEKVSVEEEQRLVDDAIRSVREHEN